MINNSQFREYIIRPALDALSMNSPEAEELLIFTCATESLGGTLLKQIRGPALGVYQCEPETHADIWYNYINSNYALINIMTYQFSSPRVQSEQRLIYDMRYSTAIARLHYRRIKAPLPLATDIEGMWQYYKRYYNTEKGKATREESIKKYKDFAKLR